MSGFSSLHGLFITTRFRLFDVTSMTSVFPVMHYVNTGFLYLYIAPLAGTHIVVISYVAAYQWLFTIVWPDQYTS